MNHKQRHGAARTRFALGARTRRRRHFARSLARGAD
jgi:hypothetical protein